MSDRPDLRLTPAEQDALLDDVLAAEPVTWAAAGADGYPVVGLVHATRDHRGDAPAIVCTGDPRPPDGVPVCLIVERGATYDDITAVVARGVLTDGRLALDDVVSFAFAKAGGQG